MRIAYYGLSSPVFYDYSVTHEKSKNDVVSSPNTILDSGFGSIILFDEIWFFCKSLCPFNMRNLPFVKFLDDEVKAHSIFNLKELFKLELEKKEKELSNIDTRIKDLSKHFNSLRSNIGINWEDKVDNHTHSLSVDGAEFAANSFKYENIIFDILTVDMIKQQKKINVELITNSFTQNWLSNDVSILKQGKITEVLLFENIPAFLSKDGPYHPEIESLRNNNYLKYYRKWITSNPYPDKKDIKDIKNAVENEIKKESEKAYMKRLNPSAPITSLIKTVISCVPYLDKSIAILDLLKIGKNDREIQNLRWHGFVISGKEVIYNKIKSAAAKDIYNV